MSANNLGYSLSSNQRGFSMAEIVVSVAIMATVALAITQLLNNFNNAKKKMDYNVMLRNMSREYWGYFASQTTYQSIISDATNNGMTNINCLRSIGTNCVTPGISMTTAEVAGAPAANPPAQGKFLRRLVEPTSGITLLDNLHQFNQGFNFVNGRAQTCGGFSPSTAARHDLMGGWVNPHLFEQPSASMTGNSDCPFKVWIYFTAECSGGYPCSAPNITTHARFAFNPGNDEKGRALGNFRMESFDFDVLAFRQPMDFQSFCTSLGGNYALGPPEVCNINPQINGVACRALGGNTVGGACPSGPVAGFPAGTCLCDATAQTLQTACTQLNGIFNSPAAGQCSLRGMDPSDCDGAGANGDFMYLTKDGAGGQNRFKCVNRFNGVTGNPGGNAVVDGFDSHQPSYRVVAAANSSCGNGYATRGSDVDGSFTNTCARLQQGCAAGFHMRGFDLGNPSGDCVKNDHTGTHVGYTDNAVDGCAQYESDIMGVLGQITRIDRGCPGGTHVTGGGGTCLGAVAQPSAIFVSGTWNNGWAVICQGNGLAVAYAICCPH